MSDNTAVTTMTTGPNETSAYVDRLSPAGGIDGDGKSNLPVHVPRPPVPARLVDINLRLDCVEQLAELWRKTFVNERSDSDGGSLRHQAFNATTRNRR